MKYIVVNVVSFAVLSFGLTQGAHADELRAGIMQHDVDIEGIGGAREKEKSVSLTAEYIWDSPDWLSWAWGAQPYVYGSTNLEGNTSHLGAGVNLRRHFLGAFYAEFGTGLSVHDGAIRVPNPADVTGVGPEAAAEISARFARKRSEIEFGSRVLFRNQLALGYELSDEWAAEMVYEHLSNGTIIGGPENEGVDSLGLRLAKRF